MPGRYSVLLVRSLALVMGPFAALTYSADTPASLQPFLKAHCFECHDTDTAKGNLDLTKASFDLNDRQVQARWVKVHDRVASGEMPPKKKARPEPAAAKAFLTNLAQPLIAADDHRETTEGRATLRRLNRLEYENAVRDLLGVPWLQIKGILPEDGEAHRFIKSGEALDISHVQMAQYLAAAEYALRQTLLANVDPPARTTTRYYARDQQAMTRKFFFNEFNRAAERATFPVLDSTAQPEVRSGKKPLTVGEQDPATREREAVAVVAGAYEPIEPRFNNFTAKQSGRYTVRLSAYSVWVGPSAEPMDKKDPSKGVKWWKPDLDTVSKGRRPEPVTVSSERPGRQLRWLATVDVGIEPTVHEFTVDLLDGETIRVDAARLFRSRPPAWRNPLAEKDGQPGVAYRWIEIDGPHAPATAGRELLAGDLPVGRQGDTLTITPHDTAADAKRLLATFIGRAYRRAATATEVERFTGVVTQALADGNAFTDALLAGYAGVLCSPGFVSVEERPGLLDDHALATRLALFLWNTPPDTELRTLADAGKLRDPAVLKAQAERLLADERVGRFTDAFADYWLDLRKLDATSPDAELYPDYYLDDLLTESAAKETHLFVAELIRANLPARSIVHADFTFLNERLAKHYGLPPVEGVALRKVTLPKDSPRGGLMTQASVLKVTANGTTTSPVLRGVWIMERILGMPPPPPPPSVPAVEPDTRGAKTIREQLAKHREVESCNTCHVLIDPTGFALEQFDILGGQRDQYRAIDHDAKDKPKPPTGWGKNGQPFTFHLAQSVDHSGELWDGRKFSDVRELKQLLLTNERLIARNVLRQLLTYATGASERFGDRARVEAILDDAAKQQYGVRTLIHGLVQSTLFQHK